MWALEGTTGVTRATLPESKSNGLAGQCGNVDVCVCLCASLRLCHREPLGVPGKSFKLVVSTSRFFVGSLVIPDTDFSLVCLVNHYNTITAMIFVCVCSFPAVVLVLKVMLHQLDLDKPFTGGIGSYRLYVLVAHHVSCFAVWGYRLVQSYATLDLDPFFRSFHAYMFVLRYRSCLRCCCYCSC